MQRDSTQENANQAVKEYKWFAKGNELDVQEQETVIAYKDWLKKEGQAVNTLKRKLSHVKTWLKQAYKRDVYVKFFRGQAELKRPHEAYRECDVHQLIMRISDRAEKTQVKS